MEAYSSAVYYMKCNRNFNRFFRLSSLDYKVCNEESFKCIIWKFLRNGVIRNVFLLDFKNNSSDNIFYLMKSYPKMKNEILPSFFRKTFSHLLLFTRHFLGL